MKKFIVFLMILTVFLSCQTGSDPLDPVGDPKDEPEETPKKERADIPLTEAERVIVNRNNTFAFNLFRSVLKNEEPEKNVLISPLSATLALGMLNNGADSKTHEEIQQTLGYGDISREEMNSYFQKMLEAMKEIDPDVAFEVANSIWAHNTFPVLPAFIDVNKKFYDAEIRNENFRNPATVDLINGWCAENTHDKIQEIIEEIDVETVMFLINALYFKGTWTIPFDKKNTKDEKFYNLDGTTPEVPTMNNEIVASVGRVGNYSLLELPYGNEAFSMTILLPDKGVSTASVLETLDAEHIYISRSNQVKIKLPRFKVEYERELNDDLKEMGMESMFNSDANLSLLSPVPTFVSMVKQKTFAEVNEEGTEAAAITVIALFESAGIDIPQIKEFYVDRPFLYFIKEKSTGTIFFMGSMNNL